MRTSVPRGPFSRSATSVVFRPSVDLSLTATIMSPGRRPALYAGEPGNGAMTIVLPLRAETGHADAVIARPSGLRRMAW